MLNELLKSMLQKPLEEATSAVRNAVSVAAPDALSSATATPPSSGLLMQSTSANAALGPSTSSVCIYVKSFHCMVNC